MRLEHTGQSQNRHSNMELDCEEKQSYKTLQKMNNIRTIALELALNQFYWPNLHPGLRFVQKTNDTKCLV